MKESRYLGIKSIEKDTEPGDGRIAISSIMDVNLKLKVLHTDHISHSLQADIHSLCNRAYEEDLSPLLHTYKDATHVLGYHYESLVCHALWVTRWLQVGMEPILRTAYIEAVATEKEYRARGFATAVMKRVAEEIRDYDLGALSPFSVAYYERLGWELWRGPLYIRINGELIKTPEDEDVMIFRLLQTPKLDLNAPLSAEWREGELW